jgi:hypothetical protein
MRDRELTYVADFTVQMAPRKYGKVPSGHPIGSLLGVCFACWVLNPTGVGSSGSQDDFLHFVCRDYLRMIRMNGGVSSRHLLQDANALDELAAYDQELGI